MIPSGSADAGPPPSTSRSTPPTAIRAAPTVTGAASGPSAWAVPVVPKRTALRRTSTRGIVLDCSTMRHIGQTLRPSGSPDHRSGGRAVTVAILDRVPGIAVIGPGAVGATFAAAAERAGHAVALC